LEGDKIAFAPEEAKVEMPPVFKFNVCTMLKDGKNEEVVQRSRITVQNKKPNKIRLSG